MNRFLFVVFPWDDEKKKNVKIQNLIGTWLMMILSGVYSLILVGIVVKNILPIIKQSEYTLLGKNSVIVKTLETVFQKSWLYAIIFIGFVCIYGTIFYFTLQIKKKQLQSILSYAKATKDYYKSITRVILITLNELIQVFLISIVNFVLAEIIILGLVSIISTISITITLNTSFSVYGAPLSTAVFSHLILYPIMEIIYYQLVIKERKEKKSIVTKRSSQDKIDFELENWREHTWGKKGYTYDWKNEEYEAFICPNCNSVISSNLVICPICGEDVVQLLEKIEEELKEEELKEEELKEEELKEEELKEEEF